MDQSRSETNGGDFPSATVSTASDGGGVATSIQGFHDNSKPDLSLMTSAFSSTNSTVDSLLTSYTDPTSLQTAAAGLGLQPSYVPYNSTDGSWTPTYDPIFGGGFGYAAAPGTNILAAAPQLQNQFFFPGATDLSVWNQDPLLLNNSWLLSPVALDGQLTAGTPPTVPPPTVTPLDGSTDPTIGAIGQSFGNIALNGSIPIPAPTLLTTAQPLVTENLLPVVMPTPVAPPPQPEKPKTWAAIASQPAKPKPPPPKQTPPTSETDNKSGSKINPPPRINNAIPNSGMSNGGRGHKKAPPTTSKSSSNSKLDVVSKLKLENNYNPTELTLNVTNARFFVIKSYAEDDIHRSIKYSVWCSTEHGNRRLDAAFREQKSKGAAVYLLFSVNGSGHFCGVAQMMSEVELSTDTGIWTQDKWKGRFDIVWIYVKDVPNNQLRHIRLENNENKPVTNSRDTQEVPPEKGKMVLKIIHHYQHTTSIFDDFEHYEKRQEEDDGGVPVSSSSTSSSSTGTSGGGKKESKRS